MEEKKYYWIKLRTDFFNQETMDFLLSQKNGCEYVVLYQMLCLQTANTDGRLINQIGEVIVPFNVEKIVRDTKYFDYDTVVVALELYKQIGLIYVEEDGNLRITDIERMVGTESASRAAIKKREQRLKKKIQEGTQKGTNCLIENRDKRLDIRDKILDNKIIDSSSIVYAKQVLSNIFDYYQEQIGTLTPRQYEILDSYNKDIPEELIKIAINKTSDSGANNFRYMESILKEWKQKGYKSIGDIENEIKNTNKKGSPEWFDKYENLEIEQVNDEELKELENEMSIFN